MRKRVEKGLKQVNYFCSTKDEEKKPILIQHEHLQYFVKTVLTEEKMFKARKLILFYNVSLHHNEDKI